MTLRRTESRRQHARVLRNAGMQTREIAAVLGVDPRSVQRYLLGATDGTVVQLLGSGRDAEWMEQGRCVEVEPELFFPPKGANGQIIRAAKRVCEGCPVRQQCLEYALRNRERFGIWGGLSEVERRSARRAS